MGQRDGCSGCLTGSTLGRKVGTGTKSLFSTMSIQTIPERLDCGALRTRPFQTQQTAIHGTNTVGRSFLKMETSLKALLSFPSSLPNSYNLREGQQIRGPAIEIKEIRFTAPIRRSSQPPEGPSIHL